MEAQAESIAKMKAPNGHGAGENHRAAQGWRAGDSAAGDELIPLVYQELRRIAARSRRRLNAGSTLQTTALAHEAYIRLVDIAEMDWRDRVHFFFGFRAVDAPVAD